MLNALSFFLFAIQPHMIFAATGANAAVEDTYRQLNLFSDAGAV